MDDRLPESWDKRAALICLVLALLVTLVFCQTGRYGFVNFDDDQYVYDRPRIKQGITLEGLAHYACYAHSYTYHPLTTYSHMLDCQLFGGDAAAAGKHHWVNVLLHAATAAGLFLMLRAMTGRLWPAAMAAAVFAVHPLRVESVAWISERKDVLSGLFFVFTLAAYVRYVRNPPSTVRYVVFCLSFAMGLLAKPMLVTLPFVLLLLDYWPLGRWRSKIRSLLVEKIPLFVLSLAGCVITIYTQGQGGAIQALKLVSGTARIANCGAAYANYLGLFFWPRGLAVLYPHPLDAYNRHDAIVKACLLAAVSLAVVLLRRRMPYLLVGWLWFLGMLVPVIGLLQVGGAAMGRPLHVPATDRPGDRPGLDRCR